MDLRQIMYFMWVYEENSFTHASRKAGVVQPALSVQVRRLEEEFGVELFERGPRGVTPTAYGQLFYDLCAPIRKDLALARTRMLEAAKPDQVIGNLRCGFPPTFFKSIIAGAVDDFTARNPRVQLTLREGYARTLSDWVLAGDLDFALGVWSTELPGLDFDDVFEEEVVLVSGRRLEEEPFTPIDIGRIEQLKLMLPSPKQMLGPVLAHLQENGVLKPVRTMIVDSYIGVMEIARASDWSALVPVTGVLQEVDSPDLFIYPLSSAIATFRWHVVHRQGEPLSPAGRLLMDGIVASLDSKKRRWTELMERQRQGKNPEEQMGAP